MKRDEGPAGARGYCRAVVAIAANIRQDIWNKRALYLGVSPMAALTHCTLDRLVGDEEAYAMMAGLMRETTVIGEDLELQGERKPTILLRVRNAARSRQTEGKA